MKKTMKRIFASMLAFAMMLCAVPTMSVAAEEKAYDVFIAFGGDAAADNDWGYQYYGEGSDVTGDVTATNATIKAGETATVSLEFASPVVHTWFVAPVVVGNFSEADFDVKVLIDGKDITDTVNFAADDKEFWAEGTGAYAEDQCIRLAGGYNEWATKYIAESPAGFTKIEYQITANSLVEGAAAGAAGEPVESTETYDVFVAFGGDAAADNDWGYQYYGEGSDVTGAITATNGTITSGGTTTVSLEFAEPVLHTWFMAPVVTASGVVEADFDVQVLIDGKDITDTVNFAADDKAFWAEGTGAYTEEQCIRLAGGYNEWATKYIAESPAGFTKVEYVITANSIKVGGAATTVAESTEAYDLFVAFGGDAAADNDWGYQYYGAGSDVVGAITATDATIKSGETVKVGLEFAEPVVHTWFVAPTLGNATNVVEADFTVKVFIDGEDVTDSVNFAADDKAWWNEGTGAFPEESCIRLAGGYNEWATKYIAESPVGMKKIEFEVTANSIKVGTAAEAESAQPSYDENGVYHAYFGVQTPTWIFRNSHDDATYGKDSGCFDQLGFIDGEWIAQGGTFTDAEIAGNGRYTVGMTGYDFSGTFQDQAILGADGLFNLLFVSTDLPMNDNIVLSNVTLKMDGKEIVTQAEAFLDADSKEVKKILLANIWNNEIEALPYYAAPTQSIEISFDVSGFAYDKAVEEAPVESAPAETTAPVESAPAETKVETAETTVDTSADVEPASNNTMVIVIVVVVVAVVAIAAGVVVSKKKKDTKAE